MISKKNNDIVCRIPLLGPLVRHFFQFQEDAGHRLGILCAVIFMGGLFEGLGLSLLLPIFNLEANSGPASAYSQRIYALLQAMGLPVTLPVLLAFMLTLFICKGLLLFSQGALTASVTTNLMKDKRLEFCRLYVRMTYDYYTRTKIGVLNNLITTEIQRAVNGFAKFTEVLVASAYILVYSGGALLMNAQLTAFVFVGCGLIFVFLRRFSKRAHALSRQVTEKNAEIQSLLIQMITNFKYLKATARFEPLYQQITARIEEHRHCQFRNNVLTYIPSSLLEPSAVFFLSALIIFQVYVQGRPLVEIFVLLVFFYKAFSKVFSFQVAWHKFCTTLGAVEVVRSMKEVLEREKETAGGVVVENLREGISLEEVVFAYERRPVLKGVSWKIPKRSTVGIVGDSGAGKTTLLDLITGLLTPQSGRLLWDRHDYRDLDKNSLRQRIGYVTQEPVIFQDTVAANISFWAQGEENRLRIEQAARLAHCWEFIEKLPQGLETVLGDRGVNLSVGQRQRVAIARELFKQPDVLILDEATSSLDSQSERLIQKSLREIKGTLTIVMIAHRLSTLRDCDEIIVLGEGRILERGSFSELYHRPDSRFQRMCRLQNLTANVGG